MAGNKTDLAVQVHQKLLENLESTHARSRKILDFLQECVFECDIDLKLTYVNRAWQRSLGFDSSELIDQKLFNYLYNEQESQHLQDGVILSMSSGRTIEEEMAFRSKSGDKRWFILRMTHEQNAWTGSLTDITDRRLIEDALKASEAEAQKLSNIASMTDSMAIITDNQARIEWVNESFESKSGYRLEEIRGLRPREFMHGPDTDPVVAKKLADAAINGIETNLEILHYKKDGSTYWADLEVKPVYDNAGQLVNLIGIENDITERLEKDRHLRLSEERLRYLLRNISDSIVRTDRSGRLLYVNPAWEALTGFTVEESTGAQLLDFIWHEDREEFEKNFFTVIDGSGDDSNFETRCKTKSGGTRWIDLRISPGFDEQGIENVGTAVRLTNIEERRRADEVLRASVDAANTLASNKTKFLAKISHEVRTPLNAIIGMSDMLAGTELDPKQSRYLGTVLESSQMLLELLNDILDFAKFESSKVTLEKIEFDLASCFESAIDMVSPTLRQKDIELVLDIEQSVPKTVIGDRMRLRQVILNLLSNAAKFTDSGHILVTVDAHKNEDGVIKLQVAVSDSGPGVAPDRIGSLFDEYAQESTATSRKFGGTGLGLAICKEVCRAANGHIDCTSVVGSGSTFSFSFELAEAEYDVQSEISGLQVASIALPARLLSSIENIARRENFKIQNFESLKSITTAQEPFDVLVVSHHIAGLGEHLESLESRPHVLQLALTSSDNQTLSQSYYLGGAFKPTPFVELLSEITNRSVFLEDHSDHTQTTAAPSELSILVAEDQSINQIVIQELLRSLGYEIDIVGDGVEALRVVKTKPYDLILMDIQMPEMDGITTTREIRALDREITQPKIVAITADALPGDRDLCLSAGMNEYMTKPLTKNKLIELLEALFSQRSTTEPGGTAESYVPSVFDEFLISLRANAIRQIETALDKDTLDDALLVKEPLAQLVKYNCLSQSRLELLDLRSQEDLKLILKQLRHSQVNVL